MVEDGAASGRQDGTVSEVWVEGGASVALRLDTGERVRLVDPSGTGSVAVLLLSARDPAEHLCLADSVKLAGTTDLGPGHELCSQHARAMATILDGTTGRVDPICGGTSGAWARARGWVGPVTGPSRFAAGELLERAAQDVGVGRRWLPSPLGLFARALVDERGFLVWPERLGGPEEVLLEAAMELVFLVANAPHPLDPAACPATAPIGVEVLGGRLAAAEPPPLDLPSARSAPLPDGGTLPPFGVGRQEWLLEPGSVWSGVLGAGATMELVDLEGRQAVDCLLYSATDLSERYGASETVVWQGSVAIGEGTLLRSNLGSVLGRVVTDSVASPADVPEAEAGGFPGSGHDTLGGACSQASNRRRYGDEASRDPACTEGFLLAGARFGLGPGDLVGNLNWFMRVPVGDDGRLEIATGWSQPGDRVAFQAAVDLLVLVSVCPQRHNPANGFRPTPVRLAVDGPLRDATALRQAGSLPWRGPQAGVPADDPVAPA